MPPSSTAVLLPSTNRVGQRGQGAFSALFKGGAQCGDVVASPRLPVRPGTGMRDDFCALCDEVAIAKPAVVLSACVDHPPNRTGTDLLDGFVDFSAD